LRNVLVTMIALALVSAAIQLAVVPDFLPTFVAVTATVGVFWIALALDARGRYRLAARLAVWTALAASVAVAAVSAHDPVRLTFPVIAVLLSGMLLSTRDTARLACAGVIALAALLLVEPAIEPRVLASAVTFFAIASGLVLVGVRHLDRREADHVARERARHEEILRADRLASIGMLSASVAHDIRNPLTVASVNLELIQLNARRGITEELDRMVAETQGSLDRIAAISRALLGFARGGEGDATAPVDVRHVVDSAIELTAFRIRHRATLTRAFAEVPAVRAAAGPLEQVFVNLLLNAFQAIPDGEPEQHEIHVGIALDDAGRVEISVRDTGVGIEAATIGRVFEPFFTTKARGEGTGLGLAICRTIVTSFGGEIRCDSAIGRGTTFRVALPALRN
jgi:signal transduction histidine kinase